jgi:predicted small lipoprotein YifL
MRDSRLTETAGADASAAPAALVRRSATSAAPSALVRRSATSAAPSARARPLAAPWPCAWQRLAIMALALTLIAISACGPADPSPIPPDAVNGRADSGRLAGLQAGGALPSNTDLTSSAGADSGSAGGWYPPVTVDAGSGASREEYLLAVHPHSLPAWAVERAERDGSAAGLVPSTDLNPFYQSGDFDGDGLLDIAILVAARATGELGVLFVHGGATATRLVGAGVDFGNGGTDFEWMTNWRVVPRQLRAANADALEVIKLESASGLIHWTGSAYAWRQLGD